MIGWKCQRRRCGQRKIIYRINIVTWSKFAANNAGHKPDTNSMHLRIVPVGQSGENTIQGNDQPCFLKELPLNGPLHIFVIFNIPTGYAP